MKKYLVFTPLILFLLISFSCSNEDLSYFQRNDPEPEFKLFNLLDPWPALRTMFNPIDQRTFNRLLADSMNDNLSEAKDVVYLVDDLLVDPKYRTNVIARFRILLNQIIKQDELDQDPVTSRYGSSINYSENFYDLWDQISDKRIGLSEHIIPIVRKIITYIKNTYHGEELEDIVSDLIDFLKNSDEAYLWRDGEVGLLEDLSKLLFQSNENIWLESNGKMITDRSKIMKNGTTNLGVGNATKGMDALLIAINEMMKDDKLREDIFIILREAGKLFTAEVQGKKLKDVIKDLTHNFQKYLTPGGEEWKKWEGYEWPRFNPYSGYGKGADGLFTDNKDRIYADANLRNTLHCFLSALQVLLLRADRDGSALEDKRGMKTYFLEISTKTFDWVEEHPDNPNPDTVFNHFEEGVYDQLRFDIAARDRIVDSYDADNFDPRTEPSPMSNLECIFGLFFGTGTTAGWTTANGDLDTGELVDHPSQYYGNLHQSGFITLANAFNGLGFNYLFGINPYEVAFTDDIKDHLFRSSFYFDVDERSNYRFNFDKNFGFLTFLGGPIVSDSGFPREYEGGRNPYDENGEPILNAYRPYSAVGFANNDFIGWLLGFIVNMIMMGQGPFYCTRNAEIDGDFYTYFSDNQNTYAHVYKPDPDDPLTWDYIYPAYGVFDVLEPAKFYADADLITDGGVYLENDAIVKINIDGIEKEIVFSDEQTWDQLSVINQINNSYDGHFSQNPAVPAGRGFMLMGENKEPASKYIPDGIIEISDVSGNGIAKLIRDGYDGKRKILREYSGRENRYRERWTSEYYLVEYKPIGSNKSIFVSPADMSGNATQPGCLMGREMIPENCIERECHFSFAQATNNNYQWCMNEMLLSLPLTLYFSIKHEVIEDALNYLLFDYLSMIPDWILTPIKNSILRLIPSDMGIPITVMIEGNGAGALLSLKFPHGSAKNPVMGRWVLNGGFGDSQICTDYRFSMIFPEKLISDKLKTVLDNALSTIRLFGIDLGTVDDIIKYAIDTVLYGGYLFNLPVKPILQHNLPLMPSLMLNAQSLLHITYPRCRTEQVVGENAIYHTKDAQTFGGRTGELLKDENGIVHPEWGATIGGDQSDINWRNKSVVGWVFVLMCQTFRDYVGYDIDLYDPKVVASSVTHNGLGLLLHDALGALARTPLCYYEYDTEDNIRPFNSWKQLLQGGKLKSDHPLGEKYYEIDDDETPSTAYILTPTDYIASSGVNKETGNPLAPDNTSIFGGWALRNFFRMADIRNFYNILIDSDPYVKEPKRCDGLLPLLTSYDVHKYETCENKPEGAVSSRLISAFLRWFCDLADTNYDDPYGAKGVDDNDMTTWGLRRKVCYGIEQFASTLRVPKAFPVALNEGNFMNIIHPEWSFSEDENGNPYPMRPEDITLEIAEFPAPPEYEDWSNFDKLMDALGELLSDNGETEGRYNIIEDLIALIDKFFRQVDATDDNLRGLRHTLGSVLTKYTNGEWEYPDQINHILEFELPRILEAFKGHYDNLLIVADAILSDIDSANGGENNFLIYFIKNFTSRYPTKDVLEQLYDFLGIDLVKRADSSLWAELADLLVDFADMIEEDELPGWFETDIFHSNKNIMESADPFRAMGEILSW
ncbi:MAG: hypothetical protein SVZ03_02055 [Spirochaetota bacterium]|nr:hypothetical protein [Spirochaetota bacterium]